MIGRLHHTVIDSPEPARAAAFWSELLGLPITWTSDDWVVVSDGENVSGLAFQLAPDHVAPRWPDPAYPQQVHFDVMVDDVPAATAAAVALGARQILGPASDGTVFTDPDGHPFCLVPRPGWAPPIGADADR